VWSEEQKGLLLHYGIALDKIKDAYRHVKTLPVILLDRFAPWGDQGAVIAQVTSACTPSKAPQRVNSASKSLTRSLSMFSVGTSRWSATVTNSSSESVRILVSGYPWDPETRCVCQILRVLIQRNMTVPIKVVFSLDDDVEPHLRSADYLLTVLTTGLLQDKTFAEILLTVEQSRKDEPIELRPVLADNRFAFPTPEFYARLTAEKGAMGQCLGESFKRMLNIVAPSFAPHSSLAVMHAQVTELCKRMGQCNQSMRQYAVDFTKVTFDSEGHSGVYDLSHERDQDLPKVVNQDELPASSSEPAPSGSPIDAGSFRYFRFIEL